MAIVNFAVPKELDRRVMQAIRTQGFMSKAEFFRMAALYFLNADRALSDTERTQLLTSAIKDEVRIRYKGRNVPSVRTQLADL